jgi:hypothetical protein
VHHIICLFTFSSRRVRIEEFASKKRRGSEG